MLPQQIVSLISLPLITGAVGYLTNKLAIKMLFRPYKAKWYTLGWQGIIPRTRPILAEKVADAVSKKLISGADILPILESSEFKSFITNAIDSYIQKNHIVINKLIADTTLSVLEKPLSEKINTDKLKAIVSDSKAADGIIDGISREAADIFDNFIKTDSSIGQVLPASIMDKSDELALYLAGAAVDIIKSTGRSVDVKDIAAERIVKFKDDFLKDSGIDFIKLSLINMFLNDDTIRNAVKRELPSILDGIADNSLVKKNIAKNIKIEIEKMLSMKISVAAKNAGDKCIKDSKFKIISFFRSDDFKSKLNGSINNYIDNFSDMTYYDIIKISSIDIKVMVGLIDIRAIINSDKASDKMVEILKANMDAILSKIDINKIVKDKINNLPLNEVEELLFSFMREHFKWINLLGFVIGFIIGCMQALVTLFI